MAERAAQKPRKRAAKAAGGARLAVGRPAGVAGADDPAARIRVLETEQERLKQDLETARARIKMLELARDQALNRIDWVIDSLHNLSDE